MLFIEIRSHVNPVGVAVGARHTLAATSTGALWAWGSGGCGQLGHDERQGQPVPRRVEALQIGIV